MSNTANFLAVDLGASGGRVMLGRWDGARFELQELHRFANEPATIMGRIHWDVLRLWNEIKTGIVRFAQLKEPLDGIGVDTWGVDFALLDRAGRLIENPVTYRDSRTNGMIEKTYAIVPRREVFAQTGLQTMPLNTLFQLMSLAGDRQLEAADTLLMMPDLFHYWLTGVKAVEYTAASTSQMLDARERRWATGLLDRLGLPTHFLKPVVEPGTVLGDMRADLLGEVGLRGPVRVIAPGSHDTASAVAAVPGLDERSAYVSSGTWSLVGAEVRQPILTDAAAEQNLTNEGGVDGTIRLLKNVAGLWMLQESRRQWEREGSSYGWTDLMAHADGAAPFQSLIDPDHADFLPPGDIPGRARDFCRRTGQPVPESVGAVMRCCLESLTLKTRQVIESIERVTGTPVETIRVVGGGSQNWLLCQFIADACGRPVVAGPVEATALGNVMVQAIAAGYLPDIAAGRQAIAASATQRTYEPRAGAAWDAALERFERLLAV